MPFPTTHPALERALAARGYDVPTAVQAAVLEEGAAGRDLLVSAQTGSGKTVAFGLAMGATLLGDAEKLPPAAEPLALIIAPTRELALQVARELAWLYAATGARLATCVGGMDARTEARALYAGAHIVVGTPGRLRDHLERGRLKLAGLKAAVLDEADEMLDLGFREDLEFILDATAAERRTLLFSATLPREIETLAGRYQRDAMRIETLRRNEQHADIEYQAHRVAPHDVENAVVNVLRLHEARAALVFCATRESVNRVNARLLERGFQSVALSGELSQQERMRALQALRDGRARVLVATDVAARGLDLPELALVIHAELPNDGAVLLHRSGRTGRAGRKGLCVLIVPYNRRRKADAVIAAARLKVTWRPTPTAEEVLARDQERFLASFSEAAPASEEESQLVRQLQEARTPEEIALTLIRLNRAQSPAPEELTIDAGPPPRREHERHKGERWHARGTREREWKPRAEKRDGWRRDEQHERGEPGGSAPAGSAWKGEGEEGQDRQSRHGRKENRPMVWFRIDIGRDRDADPRWILPLLCRAGGVTKSDIGRIKVNDRDTRFEIGADIADQFDYATRTNKNPQGHIARVGHDGGSDIAAVVQAIDGAQTDAPRGRDRPPGGDRPDLKRHGRFKGPKRERGEAAPGWAPRRERADKFAGRGSEAPHTSPAGASAGRPHPHKPFKKPNKKKHRAPAG